MGKTQEHRPLDSRFIHPVRDIATMVTSMQKLPQFTEPTAASHYGKHLVFFPSRKNARQFACNSVLEADYCILLEADHTVVRYMTGLPAMRLEGQNSITSYIPDFLVETTEELYYTEVKLDFDVISSACREKLYMAQRKLELLGHSLRLADAKSIRQGFTLRNLKFLYNHSFNVTSDEYGLLQNELLNTRFPTSLGSLLFTTQVSYRAYYKALFDRKLSFDGSSPLTMASIVALPDSD